MQQQQTPCKNIGRILMASVVLSLTALALLKSVSLIDSTTVNDDPTVNVPSLQSGNQNQHMNNSNSTSTNTPLATVGYAVSLIKCGDFQTSAAGLVDAALVLRHSIHATSIRNLNGRYDYEMYVLVHRDAEHCSSIFRDVGFTVLVVDPPISPEHDIKNGSLLQQNIHKEWCCGSDEFIKLYAYTKIPHPIVVHTDSDFFMLQNMDELFDSMLNSGDTNKGKEARKYIEMEFPKEHSIPTNIQAFYTRDWPQVIPGRSIPLFQAGFMVIRPNQTAFDELISIIKSGNFVQGRGWGGLGYRGVGGMAMQGLLAYYYEAIHPDIGVEVNQCRYNWMGMDIKYRAHPNYWPKLNLTGKCRSNRETCEDCMDTPLSKIKNVHLTQCRKPWNCVGEGCPGGRKGRTKGFIDTNAGNLTKCLEVVHQWHLMRTDFEDKLYELTKDEKILEGRNGQYMPGVFMGHCSEVFQNGYNPIQASPESFKLVPKLYE